MLHCITNSRILNASLEFVSDDNRETIIQNEFKTMCTRFCLTESEMIALVVNHDISLLDNHYDTIWESLNYYSMICVDEYKNKYITWVYEHDLIDPRIESLCDDLKEYIKHNTCINIDNNNNNNNKCNTIKNACKSHHDECVKYLLNNPDKCDKKIDQKYYDCKIRNKFDFDIVEEYSHDHPYSYEYGIVDYVCLCDGSLNLVKYFFEIQKKDCTNLAIDWACENGHLDVVEYLFEIQKKDCTDRAIDNASANGHLSIVKYLFETQMKDCSDVCTIDYASDGGHLDVVKYLFEIQKKSCTVFAIEWASWKGHLDVVKYLFEIQKKNCTTNAIDWASKNGHLDVVKYLFEIQNKDFTIQAIDLANENGHLDVVEYLTKKLE